MKTYEELLSDIEEDMELMGASHIVYSAEENGVITDYDYLPSDLCMTSTTLKDLQEKLHEQMLYDKLPHTLPEQTKMRQNWLLFFPASDILLTNHFFITQPVLQKNTAIRFRPCLMARSLKTSEAILPK